jgi:hypothetical protein
MEFAASEFWLIGTAIVFTLVGLSMKITERSTVVEQTIDILIKEGYIRTREKADGEIEILKIHDK